MWLFPNSREWRIGSRQQEAGTGDSGNQESKAGSRQPEAGSRQPTAGSQKPPLSHLKLKRILQPQPFLVLFTEVQRHLAK